VVERAAQGKRGEAFWMCRERGKEMRGVAEVGGSAGGPSLGWGVCELCDEAGEWLQHSTAPTTRASFCRSFIETLPCLLRIPSFLH
jgi:hypothetical protein